MLVVTSTCREETVTADEMAFEQELSEYRVTVPPVSTRVTVKVGVASLLGKGAGTLMMRSSVECGMPRPSWLLVVR